MNAESQEAALAINHASSMIEAKSSFLLWGEALCANAKLPSRRFVSQQRARVADMSADCTGVHTSTSATRDP